jgi:hypothetical protein
MNFKNVLKKIATPFVAIGRWIKETAWVQPLLIVGVIFGIIFCIPSITKAVQDSQQSTSIEWYSQKQLSLENVDNDKSVANDFFKDFTVAQTQWGKNEKTEAKKTMNKYASEGKFFLFFVQEDCTGCDETQEAFNYLSNNWDTLINNTSKTYPSFAYQSIFCDQKLDGDSYKKYTPFDYLFTSSYFNTFSENAYYAGTKSNYYVHSDATIKNSIESNLNKLNASDAASAKPSSDFQTPMVVEFDLNDTNTSESIIANILYGFQGSDKYERADNIANCWKNLYEFSDSGKETI